MFIAHGSFIRKISPWLMAIALVVLLPSFVIMFAPTAGKQGGGPDQTIPKLGGKEAPVAEYMKAYSSAMVETKFRYGNRVDILRAFSQQATRQAVQLMLLWREADKLGLHVSNKEVRKQIEAIPAFKNEAGNFDWYRYTGYLQGRGIKEEEFENYLRGQTLIDHLYEMITSGINLSPTQVRQEYNATHEKYKIELIKFDETKFKDAVTVSDEEAQKYYDANKDQYRTPDQVNVRYALFGFEAAKQGISPTEEQIQKRYDETTSQYKNEDGSLKSLDQVKDLVKADVLSKLAREKAGDSATQFTIDLHPESGNAPDFATQAAKYHAIVRETGMFGSTNAPPGVKAGPDFSKAAFALFKADGAQPFSEPVDGEDGFYVLQYLGRTTSSPATFEQAKAEVVDVLKAQKSLQAARTAASDAIKTIKDGLLTGKSFAEMAQKMGQTVVKPEPFSMMEGGTDIPNSSLVKSVARRTKQGAISDLVYVADGAIVFYLAERIPATDEQFAKDKDEFTDRLTSAARQDTWHQWMGNVMEQAQISFGDEKAPAAATN